MGQSFRGLARVPSAGSLRDPGPTTHLLPGPCAVLTPGGTEAGEGTKLEEDNGIRGFVLWNLGGGVDRAPRPFLLSVLARSAPALGLRQVRVSW